MVTDDVLHNDALKGISGMFVTLKEKLLTNRTAKLWFKYGLSEFFQC